MSAITCYYLHYRKKKRKEIGAWISLALRPTPTRGLLDLPIQSQSIFSIKQPTGLLSAAKLIWAGERLLACVLSRGLILTKATSRNKEREARSMLAARLFSILTNRSNAMFRSLCAWGLAKNYIWFSRCHTALCISGIFALDEPRCTPVKPSK